MQAKIVLVATIAGIGALSAQSSSSSSAARSRIDVQSYAIEAKVDPSAQTLRATAVVRFTALDDVTGLTFDLNNALELDSVKDDEGREVSTQRQASDMTVRLALAQKVSKGQTKSLTFVYDGKLTGGEESPVWGIKFAAIHPETSYLMYPGRWFPVNDYTSDTFTSDLKVIVPSGYKVVGSGQQTAEQTADGSSAVRFQFLQPSFPGSFAVVKGDPSVVSAGAISTTFYFTDHQNMTTPYGQEIGRVTEFLSGVYGAIPNRNLTVIETEAGAPNGYSSPGLLFFAPKAIGTEVNTKLLANQISRQWWGNEVAPASRNHMWIENGLARYAELLYTENASGAGAMQSQVHDTYVEALTVTEPPLIQSGRLEDYSPEFWAETAGKGAAVLHMLRGVMGDEKFMQLLKAVPEKYAWKSISTDDFHKLAEDIHGESLNYFFQQWVDSSGAPELKREFVVYRAGQGFRVVGKITQDLELFRMPLLLRIDTEGNPEEKTVQVVGTSSEFAVETFGKPKDVTLDPKGQMLRLDNSMRVSVAIKRGEQFFEIAEFTDALKEYQKALDVDRTSSLAHYRVAETYLTLNNLNPAANEFREALNGDLEPKWTEVWSHIKLGQIYDISDQREKAVNEYKLAIRTKDDTQGALEEAQKYTLEKYVRPRNTTTN